jgi:hypothetical protein
VDNQELRVGGWGDHYYALLNFDLTKSNLPSHVQSATLQLYNNAFSDYTTTPMYIDRVNTAWDEAYGWHDHPLSTTNVSTTGSVNIGWNSFDVTNLVNDWLQNPGANCGLELRPVDNWHTCNDFVSSDATGAQAAYRPLLVIQPT